MGEGLNSSLRCSRPKMGEGLDASLRNSRPKMGEGLSSSLRNSRDVSHSRHSCGTERPLKTSLNISREIDSNCFSSQMDNLRKCGSPTEIRKARDTFKEMVDQCISDWHKRFPLYNLACCEALLGNSSQAMRYLQDAVNLGYNDVSYIENSEDFLCWRGLDEFKALITFMKACRLSVFTH
eukprot:TRINITY_DN11113_c0_g2_i1.p1 TRINITY_DN11113_c0_g2~~TRINITY_DN11113_c0_g2_i1.p1  ORF type:complete len:180 (+),score=16.50 TRINITY_DN11113_c0_g2_i1:1295-1834(+)